MSIFGRREKSSKYDVEPVTFSEIDANGYWLIKKSKLTPNSQPFYGVNGDSIIPERVIRLPLTIGD